MNGQAILVVEDDPTIGEFLRMALEDEGYSVIYVMNGRDALDVVSQTSLGAVILDMRMPVLDGCGFLEAYRNFSPRPPVIAVSANSRSSGCVTTDVVAFVAKPFDLNLLINLVDKYTRERH